MQFESLDDWYSVLIPLGIILILLILRRLFRKLHEKILKSNENYKPITENKPLKRITLCWFGVHVLIFFVLVCGVIWLIGQQIQDIVLVLQDVITQMSAQDLPERVRSSEELLLGMNVALVGSFMITLYATGLNLVIRQSIRTVADVLSGFFILRNKRYKENKLELAGTRGTIISLDLHFTQILDEDGKLWHIRTTEISQSRLSGSHNKKASEIAEK